jgi:hypothetical protein
MRRYQADPEALIRKDDLQGATDLESSQAFHHSFRLLQHVWGAGHSGKVARAAPNELITSPQYVGVLDVLIVAIGVWMELGQILLSQAPESLQGLGS